jgi:hypothetical protein
MDMILPAGSLKWEWIQSIQLFAKLCVSYVYSAFPGIREVGYLVYSVTWVYTSAEALIYCSY